MLVTMRPARTSLLLLGACALAGCSTATGSDPSPDPEVMAADAEVRLVGEEQANLVLYVSNQSFDDEEVRLTVEVDGVAVVDGDFHVGDQHNWITFPLEMSSGAHHVTAKADSGAQLSEAFQVPSDEVRFAVIDYWAKDDHDPREFSWFIQQEPIAFG
ncbi:MAG: hypothetical protein AVDCRST_MAG32-1466 [uncultured Nocardioides sp.]|uniref:Uncharacterized protein n=1 Tax=uncultured Nocardioides sp. TaxID=198441 RepID=A0A6J4N7K8_9ACTN|nr:MAG: hypothetical protein AVDCRST_MAG32-1466 [uncultured Nocardioides sp.]